MELEEIKAKEAFQEKRFFYCFFFFAFLTFGFSAKTKIKR
jgi:hypothetical protein